MSPAYTAADQALLPHSQQVIDRFHVAKKPGEIVDRVRKKTQAYRKRLSAKDRKQFRSQMWAIRQRPSDFSEDEQARLYRLSPPRQTKTVNGKLFPDAKGNDVAVELQAVRLSGIRRQPARAPSTVNLLLFGDSRTCSLSLSNGKLAGMDSVGVTVEFQPADVVCTFQHLMIPHRVR